MLRLTISAVLVSFVVAQRCMKQGDRKPEWIYSTPTIPDNKFGPSCAAWSGGSCCTSNYTDTLNAEGVNAIYPGYNWNHCDNLVGKNMSAKCLQFFEWEECFYACDPWASYFENPEYPAYFKGMPVCSTVWEDWFNACADDYTCVDDWAAFPYNASTGQYYCEQSCKTFRETYGTAQNMGNIMWGNSFFYSTNLQACYSFYFWGSHNPNRYAAVGGSCGAGEVSSEPSTTSTLMSIAATAVGAIGAAVLGGGMDNNNHPPMIQTP